MIAYPSSAPPTFKFVGPGKPLKVYPFVRFLENMGASFTVKNTGGANLNDYKSQYEGNDSGFRRFHPAIYAASFPQAIKMEDASSTGDSSLAKINLPQKPKLPDRATEKDYQNYKFISEMLEDHQTKLNSWFEKAWPYLDDDDRFLITTKARNSGSPTIGIRDIFELITGETYANVSPADAEAQIALIRAPLLRTAPLEVNLEMRLSLADDLAMACPARALSNAQLYLYLSELCLSEDLRLTPVVQKFVDRPGFDQYATVPRDFVDFMVGANRKQVHLLNSGGRAFCDEYGYIPPRTSMGLATLSLGESTPTATPLPTALGAATVGSNGSKTISEAEFQEYQRLKTAQISLPTAIYCFCHGWQLDHVSSDCGQMKGNSDYTDAQRAYDKPCKAYHPRNIDGKKANLKVAPGCKKPQFWKQ